MSNIKPKEKILVAGTSYLLPFHKTWKIFDEDYEIKFANYGDVLFTLTEKNFDSILLIVIVIDDLIDYNNLNSEFYDFKLKVMMNAIESRVLKSPKPTVIIPVSIGYYNLIDEARFESVERILYRKFVNSLRDLSMIQSSLFIIESDSLFSTERTGLYFDSRNWYFSRSRFSMKGIEKIINGFRMILTRIKIASSKVLVLDCDNTLWGGVISEDSISGIKLGEDGIGKAYQDFQKEIYRLMNRGTILCLASKNNEQEVWNVFSNHQQMILKKENISGWRINWKSKSDNLVDLSMELGLGLESFVFWDDNPVERLEILSQIPQVKVIDVSERVEDWPQQLRSLDWFAKFEVTAEDLEKQNQYKIRSEFHQKRKHASDTRSFLDSLKMEISSKKLTIDSLKRAEQLSLKTNQFNLRTDRYTRSELKQMMDSGTYDIELVSLVDCFGDHGIIGMFGLNKIANQAMFLNIFLLSCRAIGRDIESWMMSKILNKCLDRDASLIFAEFVSTERNQISSKFLETQEFIQVEKNEDFLQLYNLSTRQLNGNLYYRKVGD